jgi:hypothetical protein
MARMESASGVARFQRLSSGQDHQPGPTGWGDYPFHLVFRRRQLFCLSRKCEFWRHNFSGCPGTLPPDRCGGVEYSLAGAEPDPPAGTEAPLRGRCQRLDPLAGPGAGSNHRSHTRRHLVYRRRGLLAAGRRTSTACTRWRCYAHPAPGGPPARGACTGSKRSDFSRTVGSRVPFAGETGPGRILVQQQYRAEFCPARYQNLGLLGRWIGV